MGCLAKGFKIEIHAPVVTNNAGKKTTVLCEESQTIYARNGGFLCVIVRSESGHQAPGAYSVQAVLRHQQAGKCCCSLSPVHTETTVHQYGDHREVEFAFIPQSAANGYFTFYSKFSAKDCTLSGDADAMEKLVLNISVVLRTVEGGPVPIASRSFFVNVSKNPGRSLRSSRFAQNSS